MRSSTNSSDFINRYFRTTILFLTVIIHSSVSAQTNGCGSPTVLPVNASCSYTTFNVDWDGTSQVVTASCATNNNMEDGWYIITATGTSTTITVDNPSRQMCLAAFTGCGTGELACTMIGNGGNGSITFPTTIGTQYYIQIQRRGGNNNANLDGSICATSAAPTGSGTSCTSTTPLVIGSTQCGTNSNVGSFPDGGTNNPCNASYNDGEYWFSYTATSTQSLQLDMSGLTATYSGLFVLTACPGSSPTCFASYTSGSSTNNFILTTPAMTIGQTYYIVVSNWSTPYSTNFCLESSLVTLSTPGSNGTCATPSPICSGSPISFTANAGGTPASTLNPGNDYDCLDTSPNPSWFYLEIAQAGNLVIDITAGSDVDYELWGPFPNLTNAQSNCNTYGVPQDCSYSPSAIEQAVVTGVTVGQVYVLLVTNFADMVQTININEAAANTAATNCGIVPLPVGYSQWDLQYIDRQVVLTWSTESEENNEKFVVQRSTDGLVWETIGVVAGNGTSTQTHDYQFKDDKPLTGISYYRLMQIDFDGKPTFTSILSVNTNKVDRLTVYPNPARTKFTVLTGKKTVEKLMISNPVGKTFEVTYTETENGLEVNCSTLSPGIYTLTIVSETGTQSERLMIKD
jgi:hypothetical protein